MIKKHPIAFLLIFSFSVVYTNAQTEEKHSLIPILTSIEKQHNIRFSYADKTIEDIKCYPPSTTIPLKEKLNYIESQVQLKFKALDKRFISIKPKLKQKIQPTIELLDEILVSNYLTQSVLKGNYGDIIIQPEKFNILPGLTESDILQTIQAIPGVLSTNETVSNINVRGGTHDQNLILWDNIKMYQSGHFFGLISAFSPYLTKRVLVSKNGTSAIHGDGVSSTIDMQLDNAINDSIYSGVGVNLIHVDGFTKLPLNDKIELQLTARRAITDYIETPTYNQYFNRVFQDTDINNNSENSKTIKTNEAFCFYDFGGKLLYNISEKDKLRFNLINTYNTLNYLENEENRNPPNALNSEIKQQTLALGLTHNRQWNTVFKSNIQVYLSNYRLNAINLDITNNQRLIQKNEVLDTGIKFDTNYKINETINWINGYQFFEIGVTNKEDVNNPIFISNIKKVIRSHSAFTEAAYQSKNKNRNIRVGIRSNYIGKFKAFFIEPRLSFNQRFLNHFKLEVLAEIKSQTTSQIIDRQNDFLGVEKRRWVLANDSTIPIIKSKQASIGIHYNKNKFIASAEGYFKQVTGVSTRNQGFQNQYQFVNAIGRYNVKGIDFLINKQFKNITSWLSYSLSDNEYTFKTLDNGNNFPNSLNIKHAITFANTYTLNDFKFALGINWHSGSPVTIPNMTNPVINNEINFESPNSSNLTNYFKIDFSTTYSLKLSPSVKSTIGLSLWNVLNRKNIINTYYVLNEDNSISKIDNISMGITPNLSFRLRF